MSATPGEPADVLGSAAAGPAAIRGGALRIGGYGAGVLLSLVSAALLFRHLGVVETGYYVTVLSLVAVVGGVSDAGLTAIGVRELSVRDRSGRDAFARNLLGLRIVLTGAGLVLAVAFAVLAGYPGTLVAGTVLAGIGLLFQSLQATLSISLMSALRLGWVTTAELVRQVASTVLIVAGVLAGGGLLVFLSVPIAASLAMLLLTAALVRHDIPLLPAFSRGAWRELLRDVLPYSIAVAAGVVYFRIAVLLVSLIASEEQTGFFSASFRVVDVLVAIPALMMSAVFPIFSRAASDDRARLAYGLARTFDVTVICGAGAIVMVALGAPVAIEVVAGNDFSPAADVLRIQSVAVGASFVGAFWAFALLSLRLHREILVINLLALALVGALVGVLTAAEGAEGAALGTAVAEVAILLVYPFALLGHRELVPSFRILPRVALALAPALAVGLLPLPALVELISGSGIYIGLVLALRALPEELLAAMPWRSDGDSGADSRQG